MSSYVLLAVKVPVNDLEEGIDTGALIREKLMEQPWAEEVFLLNTIPAPGGTNIGETWPQRPNTCSKKTETTSCVHCPCYPELCCICGKGMR